MLGSVRNSSFTTSTVVSILVDSLAMVTGADEGSSVKRVSNKVPSVLSPQVAALLFNLTTSIIEK